MEFSTVVVLAIVLVIALWLPYAIFYMGWGKARGRTWFNRWKPQGHSDIGPDLGGPRLTRRGADDARGARH